MAMARVASPSSATSWSSFTLHSVPRRISPFRSSVQSVDLRRTPIRFWKANRSFSKLICLSKPDAADSAAAAKNEEVSIDSASDTVAPANKPQLPELPNKNFNRVVALVSTVAAFSLFFSSRLDFGVSLKDLAANAVPYEVALSNGRPTVVEFYADWCEVCRELAPVVYNVEEQYRGQVNFVMLNVDNTKWEQELDEFGVEGIPHFAFLDKEGNEEGNVVGRLPKKYFLENVAALAKGEPSIPHTRAVGVFSNAQARKVHQVVDPRSHG
ncbi:thioredoxin superfamily protein [Wolffia australiana]